MALYHVIGYYNYKRWKLTQFLPGVLITPPHLVTRADDNDSLHRRICSSTSRLFICKIERCDELCSIIRAKREISRLWRVFCSCLSFSNDSTRVWRSKTKYHVSITLKKWLFTRSSLKGGLVSNWTVRVRRTPILTHQDLPLWPIRTAHFRSGSFYLVFSNRGYNYDFLFDFWVSPFHKIHMGLVALDWIRIALNVQPDCLIGQFLCNRAQRFRIWHWKNVKNWNRPIILTEAFQEDFS